MKLESISDVTGGWLRLLVVPLFGCDDDGKVNGLLPVWRPAAANPRMGSGNRTSKDGGKACGSKCKAVVPSHARILPRENKNAMRKNKACDPIRNAYLNRMSAQQYAEAVIATALHNGMTIEQIAKMDPKELAQAHLHTQNKATDAAAKQILAEMK